MGPRSKSLVNRCRTLVRRVAVVVALAGLVSAAVACDSNDGSDLSRRPAENSDARLLGIFRGSARPQEIEEFEQWLGRDLPIVLEHLASKSWDEIVDPAWFMEDWQHTEKWMVISVPMLPDSSGTLAEGADGHYDHHFVELAEHLVGYGAGDAILRVGHEFNCCYRWGAQIKDDPQAFIDYYRRIVAAMRSVDGADFQFVWNTLVGKQNFDPELAYPGDDVVDYIGVDVYDVGRPGASREQLWKELVDMPRGLAWHRDFSARRGKPMVYPEWAPAFRPKQPEVSGGDNAYFVEKMHDWIDANNVAFSITYNHDNPEYHSDLLNGKFPQASSAFQRLFGVR
jgi:Glycosyl hydrolase family 26